MGEPAQKAYYTKEEYLEMESAAEYKSEYYNGEIFAMAGGSPSHSIICVNLIRRIAESVENKDCTLFESNMKLELADAYVYPDLTVVCGDINLSENKSDIITNPVLIIEVLSPGTESFDRGRKFEYYRMIKSLKEYVLVSQENVMIESFYKQNENSWLYTVAKGLEETIFIRAVDYELDLKDVYYKVPLSERK